MKLVLKELTRYKLTYILIFLLAFICLEGCSSNDEPELPKDENQTAQIDVLKVKSETMKKEIEVVVIRPYKAVKGEKCPVVYLLHGHGGHAKTWIQVRPDLPEIANQQEIIFVCPDGGTSWYWDSPVIEESRYETFISKELVNYIDTHFATIANRSKRAISGLSMGGHGAMWNAIRHQDVFGAVGSTSGGLDIRPFPNKWDMKKYLGERDENPDIWDNHTVINQLDQLEDGNLAIIIDCGTEDFFLDVNKAVHEQLLQQEVSHEFILSPGAHNGDYWKNSIGYQINFFKKFFEKE
jgi:S-formylglutathione hydrolase FrmB